METDQKESLYVKFSRIFLENKTLSLLTVMGVIVLGFWSWNATPKQINPEVNIPKFQIQIKYPGATAEEVEQFITKEIEELMGDIPGVDEIHSYSRDGGVSQVIVTFFDNVDENTAKVAMRAKIDESLEIIEKAGLEEPKLEAVTTDFISAITFAFTSNQLPQNELRTLVVDIMNALQSVKNIANLEVHGGQARNLRILLDPGKMQIKGVSVKNVENAIKANNIKAPVGDIKTGNNRLNIEINNTILSPKEAQKIYVSKGVKLLDIAVLEEYYSEKQDSVQLTKNGKTTDAVYLSVSKRKGESAVTLIENVLLELTQELKKSKYTVLNTYDENKYFIVQNDKLLTDNEIKSVMSTMMQSIGIVALVLLAFLTTRAAINVAIAIPLTFLITIFIHYLSGNIISMTTLFALILALGLLVDGATVIVESAYTKLQEDNKKTPKIKIMLEAVRDNGAGLFLSTLTSVIVFLPIGAVSGTTGQFMYPMSFIVPVALIFSTTFAFSLTLFFAMMLLKKEESKETYISALFQKMGRVYSKMVSYLLQKKSRQVSFIMFVIASIVGSFSVMGMGFVTQAGMAAKETTDIYLFLDMIPGTDIPQTEFFSKHISKIIESDPEVVSVQSFIGKAPILSTETTAKQALGRTGGHQASLNIQLTDPQLRSITNQKILDRIRDNLFVDKTIKKALKRGVEIRSFTNSSGLDGEGKFLTKVVGPDEKIRKKVIKDVEKMYKNIPGIIHVASSIKLGQPKLIYKLNQEKALSLGVTAQDVMIALQAALGEYHIGNYHNPKLNEYGEIHLAFPFDKKDSTKDLSRIFLKSHSGKMIPLMSVVDVIQSRTSLAKERLDFKNIDKVYAELHRQSLNVAVADIEKNLQSYQFPNEGKLISNDIYGHYYELPNGEKYSIEWGGSQESTTESIEDLMKAFMIAFVVLYMLLAIQFNSFWTPLVILTTVPLGFIGIFPGFAVLGATIGWAMDPPVIIGFIALMGIVVNNSIMILEYINMYIAQGFPLHLSLSKAAQARFRPIMLTTFTTVLGTSFMLVDPQWKGMAVAMIFGLTTSVLFTLFLVPVLYNLIHEKKSQVI